MNDPISSPVHYDGTIQCKDALKSAMDRGCLMHADMRVTPPMAFYWWGCAFKYLWRWPNKGGITDLRKCRQCIDYLIEEVSE